MANPKSKIHSFILQKQKRPGKTRPLFAPQGKAKVMRVKIR